MVASRRSIMDILISTVFIVAHLFYMAISRKGDISIAQLLIVGPFSGVALGPDMEPPIVSYLVSGIFKLWLIDHRYVSVALVTLICGRNFYLLSQLKCFLHHIILRFYSVETEIDRIVQILQIRTELQLYLYSIVSYSPHLFGILFIRFMARDHLPFGKEVTDDVIKISSVCMLIRFVNTIESFKGIALRIDGGVIEIIRKSKIRNGRTVILYRISFLMFMEPVFLSIFQTIGPITSKRDDLQTWYIVKLIGCGGFGSVYEGLSSTGLSFAVKEITYADQRSIEMVEQEIKVMSKLEHPNIVRYYGAKRSASGLYIFLELMEGGSLRSLYWERKRPLDNDEIITYTRQILQGLRYLHENGIIHRDIKCDNVLMDSSECVKLADFGLARVVQSGYLIKTRVGTLLWMAPEVINLQSSGYGTKADIYSVGCTVLEMSTATFPKRTRHENPEIPDHLPNDLQRFIRLCLRKNPNDRPTATQLLNHPLIRN